MLGFKSILFVISLTSIASSKLTTHIDDQIVDTLEKELDKLIEQTILTGFQNSEFNSKLSVDPFESFTTFDEENISVERKPILFGFQQVKEEKSFQDESQKLTSGRDYQIRSTRSTCAGGGVGM